MRLTVVMPTYNRSDLLGRSIRGLLEQTAAPRDYEIVVVDDGSTDATPEVLDGVAAPEERFRFYRQENKGPAAARNVGVINARGDIILFTGDDCLPDSHLIEEHLKAYDEAGDVGVIGLVTWHPEIEITPFMAFLETGPQFGFGQIDNPEDVPIWHFYTANCSVPRHWIEEAGGFDEDFRHAAFEDMELAYRMKTCGLRFIYREEAKTYHHHPTTFQQHLRRQRVTGMSAALLYRKHPELKVDLGIAHAARMTTALKFWEAATEYAFALGVREGLTGQGQGDFAQLEALYDDPNRLAAGRAWVREVFGTMNPDKEELIALRAEIHRMKEDWERVQSRRLYRWSEAAAKAAWSAIQKLGMARREK